jgi:hypothetical protein
MRRTRSVDPRGATVEFMDTPLGDIYRVRLRSLEWATGPVRDLRHATDSDAVSVAVNWALDTV